MTMTICLYLTKKVRILGLDQHFSKFCFSLFKIGPKLSTFWSKFFSFQVKKVHFCQHFCLARNYAFVNVKNWSKNWFFCRNFSVFWSKFLWLQLGGGYHSEIFFSGLTFRMTWLTLKDIHPMKSLRLSKTFKERVSIARWFVATLLVLSIDLFRLNCIVLLFLINFIH